VLPQRGVVTDMAQTASKALGWLAPEVKGFGGTDFTTA
jgi:hypothetical protein